MGTAKLEVHPISGVVGAELTGVELAGELDEATIAVIRQALLDHCVIFFRDQELNVEQHKRFARRFGEIFIHPNYFGTGPDPEIVELIRNPGDTRTVGDEWHADTTMMPEPPMGAILYGIEVPPHGGDTYFANQYRAYEALSPGMKAMLEGLWAVHSDRRVAGPNSGQNESRSTKVRDGADWRETISLHPVVRTHPETGRKLLFINHSYTVGIEDMSEAESGPLLEFLLDHGHREEFTCRFRWRPGSVAFWDNRSVKHLALNDSTTFKRHMRRVQISGDKPY